MEIVLILQANMGCLYDGYKDKLGLFNAFDEFQEITEVHNSIGIEGVLRQYLQKIQCSFFFIGSRRRILLDIFNDRKRPFFQSALNYELQPLPYNDLICFIISQFRKAGKRISDSNSRSSS